MLTAKNFIVGYLIASQTITSFREKNTDSAHNDTMAGIAILETEISSATFQKGISSLGLFGKSRQYDKIPSILVNHPSFAEVVFVMFLSAKQVSALKDD